MAATIYGRRHIETGGDQVVKRQCQRVTGIYRWITLQTLKKRGSGVASGG